MLLIILALLVLSITAASQVSTPTSFTTSPKISVAAATATATATASAGRCGLKYRGGSQTRYWGCSTSGFGCLDYVCVDLRTSARILADAQDAADGTHGHRLFNPSTQSYGCTTRGFRCVDQVKCVDERTPEEREEDETSEKRKMENWKTAKLVGASVGGLLGGVFC